MEGWRLQTVLCLTKQYHVAWLHSYMRGLKQYMPAIFCPSMMVYELVLKTLLYPFFTTEILCWIPAIGALPLQCLSAFTLLVKWDYSILFSNRPVSSQPSTSLHLWEIASRPSLIYIPFPLPTPIHPNHVSQMLRNASLMNLFLYILSQEKERNLDYWHSFTGTTVD